MKNVNEIEDLAKKIENSIGTRSVVDVISIAQDEGFDKDDLLEACGKTSEDTQDKLASLGYPVRDLPSDWESSVD